MMAKKSNLNYYSFGLLPTSFCRTMKYIVIDAALSGIELEINMKEAI
ncbi:hypothetical protein [Chryseobacterium luteum]|nr:hypothetical protein [Chryseobacterium luteum]